MAYDTGVLPKYGINSTTERTTMRYALAAAVTLSLLQFSHKTSNFT